MSKGDHYPFYNRLDDQEEPEEDIAPLSVNLGTAGNAKGHDRPGSIPSSSPSTYETPYQSQYEARTPTVHVDNPLERSTSSFDTDPHHQGLFSPARESSQSNLSYSAVQKQHTQLPSKWLHEINVDPYLSRHPEATSKRSSSFKAGKLRQESSSPVELAESRRFSQQDESSSFIKKDQMLEGLLPQTTFDNPARNEYASKRDRKDVFFTYFFALAFFIMNIVGIVYVSRFPSEMRKKIIFSSSIYRAIEESKGVFLSIIGASIAVAVLWVYLVRKYTREIVWAMIWFVPTALLCFTGWGFISAFVGPKPGGSLLLQDIWLIPISLTMALLAGLFVTFIRRNRMKIETTIRIAQMATQILIENPYILVFSLALFALYCAFAFVWIIFFSHLSLIGYAIGEGDKEHWEVSFGSVWVQFYFLFVFIWTTSIFTNIQRSVIGGVVSQYYFLRHHPGYKAINPTSIALRAALTTSFGQISLASLILSTVSSVRLGFRGLRLLFRNTNIPFIRSALSVMTFSIGFAEKLIEHVSQFALYYVALKGESFCKSGRTICKVFRRNLLLAFTTDFIAQVIFVSTTIVTAIASGLATYIFAAHVLQSSYGWYVGGLFGLVAWYVMQFFVNILSDTMDATFMCYAIDLDSAKIRCQAAHDAFAKQ